MEEKKIMSPLIKGVLISLLLIILGIAGYFTGIAFESWFNWVSNGILLISLIAACIHYANQKDGYVTFGNVFSHGFKTSAIIAVILLVYSILSVMVIFPEIKEKAIEIQTQKMEEQGRSDDEIEQAMTITKKYFLAFMIFGIMIGTLLFGAVASVIGAAVAKKKPVNPLDQLNL